MDFWYIHYIGVCIIYIYININIFLFHYYTISPASGCFPFARYARDHSPWLHCSSWSKWCAKPHQRLESQGLIFAASNNVGLFRHWVTVVRSKVDAWCKCMEFSMDLLETCSEVHHLGGKLQGPCFTSWELWGARVGMLYFCWCFRLFYNILLFFFETFGTRKNTSTQNNLHNRKGPVFCGWIPWGAGKTRSTL